MRTIKKLLIGLVVLAVSVTGMQAYPYAIVVTKDGEEKKIDMQDFTEWTRGDRRWSWHDEIGYHHGIGGPYASGRAALKHKSIHFPAFLRTVVSLDLKGNALTNLVIPPGMISLRRLKLGGNTELTNLVLQQDTSVDLSEREIEDVSPSDRFRHQFLTIELGGVDGNANTDRDTLVPLKVLSAPEWMAGKIHYSMVTWKQFGEIEFDWRPSGVEIVRWDGQRLVLWGPGVLQDSYGIDGDWYDVYPYVVRRHRAFDRRYILASPFYQPFIHFIGLVDGELVRNANKDIPFRLFRLRKNTGDYVKEEYKDVDGHTQERTVWRGDTYIRPFPSQIPTVTIENKGKAQ